MSLSLEILKTQLEVTLSDLLVVDATLSRGVGLGDLQRPLPTSTVLWFCNSVKDDAEQILKSPEENCGLTCKACGS